jgi:twitching motility protein PilT
MNDQNKMLEDLIQTVVQEGASDLHISEGRPPVIRVSGFLVPLVKQPVLTRENINEISKVLLLPDAEERFTQTKEIDFSFSAKQHKARFRGNGFIRQGKISFALRLIPEHINSLQELNLPPVLESFTQLRQGFFLVVGPVGQGKTTTLASMIETINQNRLEHIITIEDPVEYLYTEKKSIIDQREVRLDTADFHTALHNIFRQDINVVLVGEMRGLETISTAVTAAETGHLVFSTLHTNDAAQTIDRIIDSFPADQQDQIRIQLASSLSCIFSQRLIPRISGGLIPAYELLINNTAVSNLIRKKRTHEIASIIETSSEAGMIDMNRSLADLVQRGEITIENAYLHSSNPKNLEKMI